MIKDSGTRRIFESGATRDCAEGRGRCDLMPLDVVSDILFSDEVMEIYNFKQTGKTQYLKSCLYSFVADSEFGTVEEMLLEVSKHFEEGAKKYGENNWQKGIPLHSYIDSAIRHFLKCFNNETDERHDRAFCWNIICAMWTFKNKPELDDFTRKDDTNENRTISHEIET